MIYKHSFLEDGPSEITVGKVVCIGKNYRNGDGGQASVENDNPVLFMKPSCSLAPLSRTVRIPDYSPCYYEVELALLIGARLDRVKPDRVSAAIAGYAVALDLTLKELLDELKQKGRPWDLAKSFEGACPISPFVKPDRIDSPMDTVIQLSLNGQMRQRASTRQMIRNPFELVSSIAAFFPLHPGDVVLTGTPAGSGLLPPGTALELRLDDQYRFKTNVQRVTSRS